MMRRVQILKTMQMGPLKRELKVGDVLGWDERANRFMINGGMIQGNHGENFSEAMAMLDRQREQNVVSPWSKEIDPVSSSLLDYKVTTSTLTVLPILGCMKSVLEFLSLTSDWQASNEAQYQFLKRFKAHQPCVDMMGKDLMRKASLDVGVINTWLKENGFSIQLPDLGSNSFYVASILDALVEWLTEGTETNIQYQGKMFQAVKLDKKQGMIGILDREVHSFPIARIRTKNEDVVFMTVLDAMPEGEFALVDKIQSLKKAESAMACSGVVFPMIDYDREVDISWMEGMKLQDSDWHIAKALQQTKFRMNEKGARVQSAVGMCMTLGIAKVDPLIVIDKPFLLWIERPGIGTPYFCGVFDSDTWKKPEGV